MTRASADFPRPPRGTGLLLITVLLLGLFLSTTDRSGAQFSFVRFDTSELATSVGPETGVQSFTLADVNDDDRDDLVAVNIDAEKALVYLAQEDGSFEEPAREFDVLVDGDPEVPLAVAVGDVGSPFESDDNGDEDGNADIVIGTEEGSIAILVGDGAGNFSSREEAISPGTEITAIALEDFDGDDKLDIFAADSSIEVFLLLNEDGNFDPDADAIEVPDLEFAIDAVAGDVNGDDSIDVVVLDQDSERLFFLTGDGEGELSEPREFATQSDPADDEQFPTDLALADVNNDDNIDAIVTNSGQIGDLQLLVRRGPSLQDDSAFSAPFLLRGLTVAEFDDNNFPDAILVSEEDPGVFLGDDGGAEGFVTIGGLPLGGVGPGQAVASGDINNDGRQDFVSLNLNGDLFTVALNQGAATVTPGGNTSTPRTTGTAGTPGTPTPTQPTNTPTPTATATRIPTVALGRCELQIQRGSSLPDPVRPVAIDEGDLDGDANSDIVVADEANRKLLVFLIDPVAMPLPSDSVSCTATLSPAVLDLTDTPVALAVGSLNRREDSFLDVAVLTASGLQIFFGNGSGGFPQATAVNVAVNAVPRSVAIADFDLDGQGDVVIADRGNSTLRLFFGRGDKTFDDPVDVEARDAPTVVLAEDLNGDTFPDIAAASDQGRSVLVYFRNAGQPRQFVLPAPTPAPTPLAGVPTALTAANLNGDGFTDLAVTVRATTGAGSFVTLTAAGVRGNVTFESSSPVDAGGRPSAIGAGQFDDATDVDLVVANFSDDDASFFLGMGTMFMPLDRTVVGSGPVALAVGDFDADGRRDVVVANQVAGTLTLLRSSVPPATPTPLPTNTPTRTGTVTPTQPTATETPTPEGTATITGTRTATGTETRTPKQGIFALSEGGCAVTPRDGGGSGIGWLLLPATVVGWLRLRRARPRRVFLALVLGFLGLAGVKADAQEDYVRCDAALAFEPVAMQSADFDSDGRPDIAILARTANDAGRLVLVPIVAADFDVGICSRIQPRITDLGVAPAALEVSDLDRNGRNDLVVAESRGIRVLEGNGEGAFDPQEPIPLGASPTAVVAGDFDRDGFIDIAAGAGNNVQVLFGLPGGGFLEPAVTTNAGQSVDALAEADFNLDGRLDLAAVSTDAGAVRILLGDATVARRFRLLSPFAVGDEPSAIVAGNFDADLGNGVDDIVVTLAGEDAAALFVATLTGADVTFDAETVVSTGDAPSALVAGDMNRDGKLDVVVANEGGSSLTFLDGNGSGGLTARAGACVEACDGDCCSGAAPVAVVLARLNDRDAFADVVSANLGSGTGSSLSFYLSDDPPTPSPTHTPTASPTPTATGTVTVTATDTPMNTPTRTDTITRTVTATITRTQGPGFQLMGESCAIAEEGGSGSRAVAWGFVALLAIALWRRL